MELEFLEQPQHEFVPTYRLGTLAVSVCVLYVRRTGVSRWQHGQVNYSVINVDHRALACYTQRRQHVVTYTTKQTSPYYHYY